MPHHHQYVAVELAIGINAVSPAIRNSPVLTGNHLGQLGNVHHLPEIDPTYDDAHLRQAFRHYSLNPEEMEKQIPLYAAPPRSGPVQQARQVLLMQA